MDCLHRGKEYLDRLKLWSRDLIFRALALLTLAVVAIGFGWNHAAPVKGSEDRLATYTLYLDLLTGLLALSTLGLWIVTGRGMAAQARDMQESLRISYKAAEAARISADASALQAKAIIGADLPIVFAEAAIIQEAHPPEDDTRHLPNPDNVRGIVSPGKFVITFKNVGRTTAIIENCCIEYRICEALPDKPEYNCVYPSNMHAVVGGTFRCSSEPLCIESGDRENIYPFGNQFWVYGFIRYRDFLNNVTTQGFCFMWGLGIRPGMPYGFVRVIEPNYIGRTTIAGVGLAT